VDLSEELRDREELSLNHLFKNARLLVGAVCHEIRNLCGAVSVVQKNLSRLPGLSENQDFQALSSLTEGLKNIAAMELQPSSENRITTVDIQPILDELRILIEPSFQDGGMTLRWKLPETLPVVWADRYGLLQVFLNIAKNSLRAMEHSPIKELTIEVLENRDSVVIYFEDSGPGIRAPERLFHPFQPGSDMNGIGLYISRAILRTFQGELQYEPRSKGTCFTATLRAAGGGAELTHD
jgi:two-component system, LuxR family, sensor kinase FixL